MFSRIVCDPAILSGKPCIRGTRMSVEFILELLASGASRDNIVRVYPALSSEDVEEAIRYAARFLKNEIQLTGEIHH
ncbi:MAG: DUF433 domain-containing protein [Acidobacteria bacterium]|nr:DUF433 domain-containing protein [Acidobacteriota bacterium]